MITDSVGASTQTQSGAIGLSGLVKGDPPTTPAVISTPTNGQTFTTNLITVSGSCGVGLLVKVFRNGGLAGSQLCSPSGDFSLTIQLTSGHNILRARNYDFADQAGPDSPDVAVDWSNATPPGGSSSGRSLNSSASSTAASGEATQEFILITDTAYQNAPVGHQLKWTIELINGSPPYAVFIDWGDGQSELKSLATAGQTKLTHTYKRTGVYKVVIKATDADGRTAYLQLSAGAQGTGLLGLSANVLPTTERSDFFYSSWKAVSILAAILLAFWLGERHELKWLQKRRLVSKP